MRKSAIMLALAFVLLVPFLFSCSLSTQNIRDDLVTFAKGDKANVKALKQVSKALRATWPFYSGCLDALSDKLSGKALGQQRELDALYASGEWNDRVAGRALVLRSLLVAELTVKGVESFLPGFLKLLTPLF